MKLKQSRQRLDPAVRSELILDITLQLFAEHHYHTVSVRDIAEACGINPSLIYYYFSSKDELLRRVLNHAIVQLQAGYDAGQQMGLNPARELCSWLDMHVPIAPMISRMVKIMADYSASTIRDQRTDQLIQDFYAREQGFLEDCLSRGIMAKLFHPVDVSRTARAISLQLDGIFFASNSRGDARIAEDIANLRSLVQGPALCIGVALPHPR